MVNENYVVEQILKTEVEYHPENVDRELVEEVFENESLFKNHELRYIKANSNRVQKESLPEKRYEDKVSSWTKEDFDQPKDWTKI